MEPHDKQNARIKTIDSFGRQLDSKLRGGSSARSWSPLKSLVLVISIIAAIGGGGLATAKLIEGRPPVEPLVVEGSLKGEIVFRTSEYGGNCTDGLLVVDFAHNAVTTRCNDGSTANLTSEERSAVEEAMRQSIASLR